MNAYDIIIAPVVTEKAVAGLVDRRRGMTSTQVYYSP